MRRLSPGISTVTVDEHPVELRAGRCIEVWADHERPERLRPEEERRPDLSAFVNYGRALWRYLDALGLRRCDAGLVDLKRCATPWSFTFIAERDPQRLARRLEDYGLPFDWQPSRARPLDFFGPEAATGGVAAVRRRAETLPAPVGPPRERH